VAAWGYRYLTSHELPRRVLLGKWASGMGPFIHRDAERNCPKKGLILSLGPPFWGLQ
jgi:hypothetical protein